jgi:hypothetical protein
MHSTAFPMQWDAIYLKINRKWVTKKYWETTSHEKLKMRHWVNPNCYNKWENKRITCRPNPGIKIFSRASQKSKGNHYPSNDCCWWQIINTWTRKACKLFAGYMAGSGLKSAKKKKVTLSANKLPYLYY